jgi:C_GCAxxG_C_C family probable redox protein
MAIGLAYGRTRPDDDEAKEKTYNLSQEFLRKFRERNKSITCIDLLGVDISAPDGIQKIEELGLEVKVCQKAVRDAAEILEEIL